MSYWRISLVALLLVVSASATAWSVDYGLPDYLLIDGHPAPYTVRLNPAFAEAAKDYNVPVELLLALGYFGSNFENRAYAPTIEKGYGVMALRQGAISSESLSEAERLTGRTADELKIDPEASIAGAAAVLDSYAKAQGVDRSAGLDAWLGPVVTYAGLGEKYSEMFAGEVFGLLKKGLEYTNRAGELFVIAPQKITLDIEALYGDNNVRNSPDYGPAAWDPAPSCNMSGGSYYKDTIVIHTVEGSYAGCISWVKNCNSDVSVQYVVAYDGRITQMVRDYGFAWHAGCYNSWSIGYEHEGYAASASHPQSQYDASAALSREICDERGIPKEHRGARPGILGHVDVTNCCCGTHWDPGPGWDWGYYISQVVGAPPAPSYAGTYVGQSYPSTMETGSTAIVWVEFRNDGTGGWTHGNTRLGTFGPYDRSSPFCNTANWVSCNRPTDVDQSSTTQGNVGRFSFILKAPDSPGAYVEQYQLVQEGVTWFGDVITFWINVVAPNGNLTGTVRNAANAAPIAGATVTLPGVGSATTDGAGAYTFGNIRATAYTATAEAAGFNSASAAVTVPSAGTATLDFSLTPVDAEAPSAPGGLTAEAASPSQINLTWNAATDNVGVVEYRVFRDGAEIGSASGTSFQDNGLAQESAHSYFVRARDAANNFSENSNTASATTFPGTVPIFRDGFINTDYWVPLVEGAMPGPYPPNLVSDKNHNTWPGSNSLNTRNSDVGTQGCLIGHQFTPAFAQAKFETWFFDGSGMGYMTEFEGTTDGWASTRQNNNSAFDTIVVSGGGVGGDCLRGGSANEGTIAGWTTGCHKEITGGFTAGDAYNFTMWSKWPGPPAGKAWTTVPKVFVQFFDGAGGVIRTDYSGDIICDNNWRQYGVSNTIPAGTAKIWVGHWGYMNATATGLFYYADNPMFTTNAGVGVNNNSRQGLQVRCLDNAGVVRAIYFVGCYPGTASAYQNYSVGQYKVCGTGCTGWSWNYDLKPRTAGWHKFTLDFLPYTGAGDIRAYIDDQHVATLDRTLDTQTWGLNMVAYGFHYRVNVESWFDDVAMYANQPHPAPTALAATPLSPTSIRWNFTDNSNNEIGFKVQDSNNVIMGATGALTGTGSSAGIVEEGLQPNTRYSRVIRAYNGSLDSYASAVVSAWTPPASVDPSSISCNKQAGVWYNNPTFAFTAVGGFGTGSLDHYDYVWTSSPTYDFVGAEQSWNSGQLLLSLPADGQCYLHAKAFGADGSSTGTLALGPYQFDGSAPDNPSAATETHGAQSGQYQSAVSDPAFTWPAATDAVSGIAGYSVYFGSDPGGESSEFVTAPEFDAPAVTATGEYYLRARARDAAGNDAAKWVTLFTFRYNADKPSTPQVSDDGPYSPPASTIHVVWSPSNSLVDIVDYQYAIGTSGASQDVTDWTSVGNVSGTMAQAASGLAAGNTYFVFVKAKDANGIWSEVGVSDGIQVVLPSGRIGDIKSLPDGTPVALTDKLETAAFAGGDYIQEQDRSSGIKVASSLGQPGSLVSVAGVMETIGHERVIGQAALVELRGPDPANPVIPLWFQISQLGGSAFNPLTEGITDGLGLNNVGLLVSVAGWVSTVTADSFELTDGSPVLLPVVKGVDADLSTWTSGDFVQVIGICTLTEVDGKVLPMLRVRDEGEITRLN